MYKRRTVIHYFIKRRKWTQTAGRSWKLRSGDSKTWQYEQVFSESIQYKYPLTDETCSKLKRFQQILGLSDQAVNQIEEWLLSSQEIVLNSGLFLTPEESLDLSPQAGEFAAVDRSVSPAREAAQPASQQYESEVLKWIQLGLSLGDSQIRKRLNSLRNTLGLSSAQAEAVELRLSENPQAPQPIEASTQAPEQRPPERAEPVPPPALMQDRVSSGNRILISREEENRDNPAFETAKQQGAAPMEKEDYPQAAASYQAAIQAYPNATEPLIYLNNAQTGDKKAYTIAASVPITGSNPGNALEMLRGFAQAQNEINQAGEIKGTGLKIKIFDDSDDPETAKQVAAAIVQDSEVLTAIGHWSSGTSLATAPIYDARKTTLITPISTATILSEFKPYVFWTNLSTETGGHALANYALTKLNKKILPSSSTPKVSTVKS